MKKYKIVTDNLDWYGLKNGMIIEEYDDGSIDGVYRHGIEGLEEKYGTVFLKKPIERAINLHPKWFEEIQEKEYSENELKDFACCIFKSILRDKSSSWKTFNIDELFLKWESDVL